MAKSHLRRLTVAVVALAGAVATPGAQAAEVWVGAYGHDAIAPRRHEYGVDVGDTFD